MANCAKCDKRAGTVKWGDFRHYVMWCELCAVRAQAAHAEDRARALPELRARLAELEREDGTHAI